MSRTRRDRVASRTAIILAGGRSERFGSDKLRAELDGASLLETTIDRLAAIVDRIVVAGPALPEGFTEGQSPVSLVPDAEPFGGPLLGLASALAATPRRVTGAQPGAMAIVIGGDMPRIVPAVLAAMLDHLEALPEIEAVGLEAPPNAPLDPILPTAIRIDRARTAADAELATGGRSLRGMLARLSVARLPLEAWRALDPGFETVLDVDTTTDLDRLRAQTGSR